MFSVQELYKAAEANRGNMWSATHMQLFLIYFFCTTATTSGGLQKKKNQTTNNIKAVKYIPCQVLTTKPGHFLMHKP